MTTLLALDAGVHECAAGWFDRGVLSDWSFVHAGDGVDFGPEPLLCGLLRDVDEVAIEIGQLDARPGIYAIPFSVHVAYVAGLLRVPTRAYTPSKGDNPWIGSLQKPIHHHRIWQTLTVAERALFPADTEARIAQACAKGGKDNWRKPGAEYYGKGKGAEVHNLLDATGLGLHHLGRYREVEAK